MDRLTEAFHAEVGLHLEKGRTMKNPHIFGSEMDEFPGQIEIAPGVLVSPGVSLTVVDRDGVVASWVSDEWKDNPSLVTAAINAAVLATARGPSAVREDIKTKGDEMLDLIAHTRKMMRPKGIVQKIKIPIEGYEILVRLSAPKEDGSRAGAIRSNISQHFKDDPYSQGAAEGIEKFILALMVVGANTMSKEFVEALEVTLEGFEEE